LKRLQELEPGDQFYVFEFIRLVKDNLMKKLYIGESEAESLIDNSLFRELIEDDPEFVLHHGTTYWVEEIISEQEDIFQYI